MDNNVYWFQRFSGEEQIRPNDHRDPTQRDRARILHSAAFRRLQSKTQILGVGQNDFYRTRLTHSLEVSQIGTGLTAQLRQSQQVQSEPILQNIMPSDALIESLCLAHDLGHPPFGHGGEVALNYMMRNSGGFEANGQTFRIITKLEPYTEHFGMDLTRRTILGLIKYPQFIQLNAAQTEHNDHQTNFILKASEWKPVKGLFLDDETSFDWLLSPLSQSDKERFTSSQVQQEQNGHFLRSVSLFKSFDASIMELADDIAYSVHDLEDAIVLEKVTLEMWHQQVLPKLKAIDNPWTKKHSEQLTDKLFSHQHHLRKNAIGALVNHLITNITIKLTHENFEQPLLAYNAQLTNEAEPLLNSLKEFVYNNVILASDIQQLEFRGQRMLLMMFEAFKTDPLRLLPKSVKDQWLNASDNGANPDRVLCDYLASMSDEQACRSFNTLFNSTL